MRTSKHGLTVVDGGEIGSRGRWKTKAVARSRTLDQKASWRWSSSSGPPTFTVKLVLPAGVTRPTKPLGLEGRGTLPAAKRPATS